VSQLGREKYVDEQLNPDDDDEVILKRRLHGVEVLEGRSVELRDLPYLNIVAQLQQAAILRAVYSRHQLRERLVDFWSDHFNVYALKGYGAYFKPADDLNVVRRHALGSFPAMLRASAHSPAMLTYLDNRANSRGAPNENYARELMELHTLGVGGGYTQKDVQELARCLTGWTIEERFLRRQGTPRFDAERHDNGSKNFLGVHVPAGQGQGDIEQVLAILAAHPSTARFIAGKLTRYFLGRASAGWTSRLASIYRSTGGDIKAMLRPLLLSDDLKNAPPTLKRPFDFLVSALRALNADTNGGPALQAHLTSMGQPLYQWPMPDGYPHKTSAWDGSLLARWNFALALCAGTIGGTTITPPSLLNIHDAPARRLKTLIEGVTSRSISAPEIKPLAHELNAHWQRADRAGQGDETLLTEVIALLLASPQFQWR
jgi:uncharacterized protein (DUF1800 family)